MSAALPIRAVRIPPLGLAGDLRLPGDAVGLVIFAHGSGSSRLSPRNCFVAEALGRRGMASLLIDLLTDDEAASRANIFDIQLLAGRLSCAVDWARSQPGLEAAPIGLFGASTGAAAALVAAAGRRDIAAIVSRGGRPDLAGDSLNQVTAPTLLIVGGEDEPVLGWNRAAARRLGGPNRVAVIAGATHLFEEPGALEQVVELAGDWFANRFRDVL